MIWLINKNCNIQIMCDGNQGMGGESVPKRRRVELREAERGTWRSGGAGQGSGPTAGLAPGN